MSICSINSKGPNIVDSAQAHVVEKSVGSPSKADGDEIVQFQADQFITNHFRLVSRPKKKRTRGGQAEGLPQEQIGFHSGLSSCRTDNNHNTNEYGTTEDPKHRLLDIRQTEPTMDLPEAKTKEVETLLVESFEAYNLGHYGAASNKYKMAWEMITDTNQELDLEKIEKHVVCYMLALSLFKTNQPNNLLEAVKLLVTLEKQCSTIFPAVYYGLSLVHHKHYRFALALKAVEDGFAILMADPNLTEYTIPGSNDMLKEFTKDGLLVSLAAVKDECSKWHPPDAVCCMRECLPSSQWYGPDRNIYFSDPMFNGMVVLTCSNARNPCTIKFHQACWKLKKDQLSALKKLSDKDIIVAGYKCFTPNCEDDQGGYSLITTIQVYDEDGKLKTRVDASTNPLIWGQQKRPAKGAVPKQQVVKSKLGGRKEQRPAEKIRRPVATAFASRAGTKEAVGENCTEMEWRFAKLTKLRQNNFDVKPDREWRLDVDMYGNPQMMEIGDLLGGPIFEHEDEQMAAIKTFVFMYFYDFIKEVGCVKKSEISQKWEEDKFIFDNYSDILHDETDICEFLLQSFKLVSLGDYIGIAENLPQLYTVVRNEMCSCLGFLLADSLQCQTAIVQDDDTVDIVSSDCDEKNKVPTTGTAEGTKADIAIHPDDIQHMDGTPLLPTGDHVEMFATSVSTASHNETETIDTFQRSQNKVSVQKPLTPDSLPLAIHRPFIYDDKSGIPDQLGNTKPSSGQAELISNPEEEGGKQDVAAFTEGMAANQSYERIDRSLLQETDIHSSDLAEPVNSGQCRAGINGQEPMELVPQLHRPGSELKLVDNVASRSADRAKLDDEVSMSLVNSNAPDVELLKRSTEEQPDSGTSTGITFVDTELTKSTELPSSQDVMAESNVQKIESDLASMAKAVAQLKSVLEQNQVRSENHAQILQQEFLNHKRVSQEGMSELVKDLKRLESRCAQLEAEKSEITATYEECQLALRRMSEDNVSLKLSNIELRYKYDNLGKEKTDLELNLDLLKREKSAIEYNLETLQKERDKMDKKLQKYHARLKDKSCVDSEMIICQQKEQQTLAVTKLSERKSKLESLTHEFNLNKYELEKAFEKCSDHLNMLNDVSKLVSLITGQQFVATEAQSAWQETDYRLRHTVARYEEKYTELKALLESHVAIENFDDIKLPTLNIHFPQSPSLTELYYNRKTSFNPYHIPGLPAPWAMPGVPHQHQDSRFVAPAASTSYPGQNFETRINEPAGPVLLTNRLPQIYSTTDSMGYANQWNQPPPLNGADCQRDTVHRGPGYIGVIDEISVETENDANTVPRQDLTLQDTERYVRGVSQASECTTAVDTNTSQGLSPIPVLRQPTSSKKIGKDQLMRELKKKFIGVPELDLLQSVEDVRKLHNDTLSGMRIEDIIRESEPYVKQRQEKHMAYYLQTRQMLPPERSLLPRHKTNQRKISSSAALGKTYPRSTETIDRSSKCVSGQQKKIRGGAQEQHDMLGNQPANVLPVMSAAIKKPAWGPVASGLVDWTKNEEDSECTICLGSMSAYNTRAPMYILPCKHSFHTTCIKQWLSENSVCPICRIHCTMDDEFPPLPS